MASGHANGGDGATNIPFRWNGLGWVFILLQRCRSDGAGWVGGLAFATKVPFRWNGRHVSNGYGLVGWLLGNSLWRVML